MRVKNKSPRVVHNVLNYLVQNFLKESCSDPDMFDGSSREGLRRAAGSGGALSPQRFMSHALRSPTGHKAQVNTIESYYCRGDFNLWKFLLDFIVCNPQKTTHKCVP